MTYKLAHMSPSLSSDTKYVLYNYVTNHCIMVQYKFQSLRVYQVSYLESFPTSHTNKFTLYSRRVVLPKNHTPEKLYLRRVILRKSHTREESYSKKRSGTLLNQEAISGLVRSFGEPKTISASTPSLTRPCVAYLSTLELG